MRHWHGTDRYGIEATRTACGIWVSPTIELVWDNTGAVTCVRCLRYLISIGVPGLVGRMERHQLRDRHGIMPGHIGTGKKPPPPT